MATSRCSYCRSELSPADQAAGKCSTCGHALPTGAAPDDIGQTSGANPDETIEFVPDDVPDEFDLDEFDIDDELELELGDDDVEDSGVKKTVDLPATVGIPSDITVSLDVEAVAARKLAPIKPVRRELSADQTDRMTRTWQSSFTPDIDATMTLKPDHEGTNIGKSTLVVSPRAVREIKDPFTTGADYELLDVIGRGGMGVVYAARQASVDRTVAIKMLKTDTAKAAPQRGKFMTEAVVTGDLDHPNIVPIYELGTSEDGSLFYSMKRVQGTPWSAAVAEKSFAENLGILMKVADAVAFAHANGVIHRDLKPENIMLGDFGEVLLMDWGLALATSNFRHEQFITSDDSMGGTPAYMSPEMATGPFAQIGFASDVYLLGAVLFEIITGKTPHTGKNVHECLVAAAHNEIQPTDATGELLGIAYHAMATESEDRYETVLEFQTAVREYQAHSESIVLSNRASEELQKAGQSDDYQDFARAVFAFQEALNMWDGNETARAGQIQARLEYAKSAERREDFELGVSLLDPDEPDHAPLLDELKKSQHETRARKRILKLFKAAAAVLLAAFLVVLTVAFVWIRAERNTAIVAKEDAETQRDLADDARKQEETAKQEAQQSEQVARRAERAAHQAQLAEEEERLHAEKSAEEAREAERAAKAAEEVAVEQRDFAQEARRQEEYQAYIARIGLAAAKTEENAFRDALRLLDFYTPDQNAELAGLRHWEWGRLRYLCDLSLHDFDAGAALDAVAFSADGTKFVTGSRDGLAHIWLAATGRLLAELPHPGAYVFAVAFSPDGKRIATGSSLEDSYVTLWDATSGQRLGSLRGHTDAVLSVAFSRDSRRLLSASYDGTAKLWALDQPTKPIRDFVGHNGWVWSAAFAPDEQTIVTASQDGTAILWPVTGPADPVGQLRKFHGHRGPVLCAAFSPDGRQVASGGYDRRVLVWDVDETRATNLREIAAGGSAEPQPFRPLDGHEAPVRSVVFSPTDARRVLSGGNDNTLRVWDAETGRLVKTLRGHSQRVTAALFSPSGDRLLSASHDGQAKLWSLADYRENRTLHAPTIARHDDDVLDATFSTDGRFVVTASGDRSARIWNVETGQGVKVLAEGHAYLASRAVFSSDGRRLITAAGDNTARVWRVATGTQQVELVGTGRAAALALSHSGRLILTGSNDRGIRLWNVETGQPLPLPNAQFGRLHEAEVTAVAFAPDDLVMFTGDEQGLGVLWNAASGERIATLRSHSGSITAAVFHPSGQRLLTASVDGSVVQWDVASGEEIAELGLAHGDSVLAMDVAPDGRFVITACADGTARLWNSQNGTLVREVNVRDEAVGYRINSVAFSPDGGQAVLAIFDNRLAIWNIAEDNAERPTTYLGSVRFLDIDRHGALIWSAVFTPDGQRLLAVGGNDARLFDLESGSETLAFSPHATVASAHFSADGRRIVTGSWDNTAKVWDVETGRAILKLDGGHTQNVNSAVFSPDAEGHHILTASDDHTAKLWDATTGRVVREFAGHSDRVRCALFSPDGQFVLTASADQTARIWNRETSQLVHTLTSHQDGLLCAAYSSDGQWIATGSEDNTAKIFSAVTGRQRRIETPLEGHTASVTSVAFSPDGRRVLTGSQDSTAKLWDAISGREILTLRGHGRDVTSVAFSPDGLHILTGSRDGTALLWPAVNWRD